MLEIIVALLIAQLVARLAICFVENPHVFKEWGLGLLGYWTLLVLGAVLFVSVIFAFLSWGIFYISRWIILCF